MRAALYARVSTEEQLEGYSIDAQRRSFHIFCHGKDWSPHREYIEERKSARTENINKRPVFKEAIAEGLNHHYDVLVVHKVDRFSRKLRITLEYFDKLAKARVGFASVMEQMDFSTPWGKLALSMLGGLAEFYSDNLSQETKKGWAERKAQGLYCGLLPFGVMKGDDEVPIPHPDTYPGLAMAFELAAQGRSDRDVAQALNAKGYRTAGNQGNGPFTKDTVRDMLQNRFYVGELPDGSGGSIQARHGPLIDTELFGAAQEQRSRRHWSRNGSVRNKARTYSLSGMVLCQICKSKAGIHRGYGGRPRLYCRGRAQGADCGCKGTFLEVYEAQIQWYLENFAIPRDYQEKILEAHRKLDGAYNDAEKQRTQLQNRLRRIKDLYRWEHIDRDEYLREYEEIQRQLSTLMPSGDEGSVLTKLARFLANVSGAWKAASQDQRNKLASTLFEEAWVEHNMVVGVKPTQELKPFFQLSYEEHLKSSRCDPEGIRTLVFKGFQPYLIE